MFEGEQETASLPGKRVRQGADEFGGEVEVWQDEVMSEVMKDFIGFN